MTKRLPHELIAEILSWLPAKYLIKFRCVSKTWLKLLKSDIHFINLHFHRSIQSNHSSLLLIRKHHGIKETDFYHADFTSSFNNNNNNTNPLHLDFPILPDFWYPPPCDHPIIGMCNGLLCLTTHCDKPFSNVYVWNPLTNVYITIPCPSIPSYFCLKNYCYKNNKVIRYAFGFHQGSNEYKLLRFMYVLPTSEQTFQTDVSLYTLGGSGVWKTLDSVSYYINALEPALVNGFLHWISPLYYNSIEKIVVSFDIKDEVFHEILMPKGFNYDDYEMQAGELGGSLCIFARLYEWEVEVWVMKEYGVVGSWTKLYKVGRAEIEGEFFYLEPLGVANSGEIIAWKNGLELLLYNPKTNLIRTLEKFGVRFSKAYTFIGSLVSPKVINGVTLSDTLRI